MRTSENILPLTSISRCLDKDTMTLYPMQNDGNPDLHTPIDHLHIKIKHGKIVSLSEDNLNDDKNLINSLNRNDYDALIVLYHERLRKGNNNAKKSK
jgi:hypothetical protein